MIIAMIATALIVIAVIIIFVQQAQIEAQKQTIKEQGCRFNRIVQLADDACKIAQNSLNRVQAYEELNNMFQNTSPVCICSLESKLEFSCSKCHTPVSSIH